jgi:ABC-2 type transport system permease protein
MQAIVIALKDLQVLFKDRGALLLMFLLPLVFIVVFSGALAAIGDVEPEDSRIVLAVVDLDRSEAAQNLMDDLEAAGGIRVEFYDEQDAATLLDEGELARVLTIPSDYSARLEDGRQVTLRLINHADADAQKTEAVWRIIDGVARDITLESQIFASLQQMGEMQADVPEGAQVFSIERSMAQARSQFESAEEQPLIDVVQRLPNKPEDESEEMPEGIQLAVSGFTVLFIFLLAQTTARSIYDEKKAGSFRRLMAAPLSKASLLSGKMLPNFLTALFQAAVIFAFGLIGMRLLGLTPLSLGDNPWLVVLIIVVIALCSVCLGILIAAIARTESQIGGLSGLLLWGMALLGGSFVPLFILEQFLGPVTKIVPHYWGNSALNDVLVRGLGPAEVATELMVMLGFAAVFLLFGLWRFEYD